MAQHGVDVDARVGPQPVHLLAGCESIQRDRVLGHPAPRQGEPLADAVHCQGGCPEDAQGGIGQGQHALGMQVAFEQAGEEAVHFREAKRLGWGHLSPAYRGCRRRDP